MNKIVLRIFKGDGFKSSVTEIPVGSVAEANSWMINNPSRLVDAKRIDVIETKVTILQTLIYNGSYNEKYNRDGWVNI